MHHALKTEKLLLKTVNHSLTVSQGINLHTATRTSSEMPVALRPVGKLSRFATRSGLLWESTQRQVSKFFQLEELGRKKNYTNADI